MVYYENVTPFEGAQGFRSIRYYSLHALTLIELCLIFTIFWHFYIESLEEGSISWQLAILFIVMTYVMGVRAREVGNPEDTGSFYALLFWTIALTLILIPPESELYILMWIGTFLLIFGSVISSWIYYKLYKMAFYLEE